MGSVDIRAGSARARGWVSAGACVLTLFGAGCARCSDEPRVPFKLNPDHPVDREPGEPETQPGASGPAHTAHVFAQAVDQPVLGGSALALTRVRAALEADLDGDGDQDALAVREDENQAVRLLVVTREASGFSALREVNGFAAPALAGCTLTSARLEALSSTKAIAALEFACPVPSGEPPASPSPATQAPPPGAPPAGAPGQAGLPAALPSPGAPSEAAAPTSAATPASPTAPRSSLSLLSLEAMPRVYERIDALAGAPGEAPLSFTPSSVDADNDGHDDVAVTLMRSGASPTDAIKLVWFDRPSGLVRDLREPEAALSAWASAAQDLLAKASERAIARAELALAMQRAICRELGAPQLASSGAPGVPCGALKSTSSLLVTLVSAYAKRGELGAAFESYRLLRRAEPKPSERLLEQAHKALLSLKAEPEIALRRGPEVVPVRAPRLHLPSARFIGEGLLYVQRASPILYDLARDEENAAPSASDQLLRDPSGQLIATALERTCEGHAVRIERAPPPGSDYVSTPAVAYAVLAPAASPPGCTRSSNTPDDGGFRVLGWAPQGLLAARGSELRLVPLASNGQPNGALRVLPPDAPRPAPLPSGVATADGARYVAATPYGVLVYGPISTRVELWRPEGYTSIAKGPLEAAISPSAQRVAVIAAGSVYLLERAPAR